MYGIRIRNHLCETDKLASQISVTLGGPHEVTMPNHTLRDVNVYLQEWLLIYTIGKILKQIMYKPVWLERRGDRSGSVSCRSSGPAETGAR